MARTYGTTVEHLLAANPQVDPKALQVGSAICIPLGGAILRPEEQPLPEQLPATPEAKPGEVLYTMKEGDSLAKIAADNGLFLEQLLYANPNVNPGYAPPGTILVIPSSTQPIPGSVTYIVGENEQLLDILRKLDISYGRLKMFNPDTDLTQLKQGQTIFVPEVFGPGANCQAGTYSYTIKTTDTLLGIAKLFDLTVNDLLAANAFKDLEDLRPGAVICLPLKNLDDTI